MAQKNCKKEIKLTLRYSEVYNKKGEFIGGGMKNRRPYVEAEMWVEIVDGPVLEQGADAVGSARKPQIHLFGTRKAFKELGVFFLGLANYVTPDSGYRTHVELSNSEGQLGIHFIVHLPIEDIHKKPVLLKVHTGGVGILGKDGKIIDITPPIKRD